MTRGSRTKSHLRDISTQLGVWTSVESLVYGLYLLGGKGLSPREKGTSDVTSTGPIAPGTGVEDHRLVRQLCPEEE